MVTSWDSVPNALEKLYQSGFSDRQQNTLNLNKYIKRSIYLFF